MTLLDNLEKDLTECHDCPRLVKWREQVAIEKRASFSSEDYWGRPVPGWGDPNARIVIVGLAPAAHGANRTGRMFTGDRSGEWLYRALHRAGLASQPTATDRNDGLMLNDVWITAAVRCAPPQNKPTPSERDHCVQKFLIPELDLLSHARVIVCLGKFAHDVMRKILQLDATAKFAHGAASSSSSGVDVLCSFHPSQQNTFTGKLTEPMFDSIFAKAKDLAGIV